MRVNSRGQASVEYVVLMIFLLGFIIMAALPVVRENELNQAVAAAREATIEYAALNPDVYSTGVAYSGEETGTVTLSLKLFSFKDNAQVTPIPQPLQFLAVERIRIAVNGVKIIGRDCVEAASFDYCVV